MQINVSNLWRLTQAAVLSASLSVSLSASPCAPQGGGGPFTWRNVRIDGMGFVTGLVVQPEAPHHLFARTDVGGLYRFDRAAEVWRPLMDNFALADRPALDIEAFATLPGEPLGLVALAPRSHPTALDPFGGREAFGEVWRTVDDGATWTTLGLLDLRLRVAPNGEYRGFTGERIAVDPHRPERLLVASRLDGVYTREVSGQWVRGAGDPAVTPWVDPADPANLAYAANTPGLTFVAFDPASGTLPDGSTRLAYLGDHETGVYRSLDGGRSWALLPGSPRYAARISVAPDGYAYVNTLRQAVGPHAGQPELGGLYRFDSASETWTDITPTTTWSATVRDVRPYAGVGVHPLVPSILLASVSQGHDKFLSRDRGANWVRISALPIADQPAYYPPPTPQNYQTHVGDWGNVVNVFDPTSLRAAWGQNGFGVVRTPNVLSPFSSWRWQMEGFEELVLHSVLVPPVPASQGGAALLSSCMDMMGFRHERVDAPPTARIGAPLLIGQASGLAYSALAPEHAVWVGWDTWSPWVSLTGRSSDNGRTWAPFADASPGRGGRIAQSATDPLNLVWEPSQWAPPQVSFDGGATWQRLVDLDATFDPQDPDWNLIGPAWHVSNPWWQGAHLVADRVDGRRFYRYTWGTWYTSADGGASWRRGFNSWSLGPDAPDAFTINTRLVPHPTRAGELWVAGVPNSGRDAGRLFRTTDGGLTIAPVPSVAEATLVAFGRGATGAPPTVYLIGRPVGGAAFGAYASADDGATWALLSDPAEHGFARAAALDGDMREEGVVYVAMSGRGVLVGRRAP